MLERIIAMSAATFVMSISRAVDQIKQSTQGIDLSGGNDV